MRIKNIIILLVSVFFLASCYEDKENYDLKELNEINISEVLSTYYCSVGDTVKIEPKLEFAIDSNATVKYEWNLGLNKVLGKERNLYFVVPDTASEMEYILFSVEDLSTGFKTQITTTLMVTQRFSSGWLILSDKGGKSSLNYVSRDFVDEVDGEYIYEFNEFLDVYKTAEKSDLGTEPLCIHEHWRRSSGEDGHIIVVQKGGQGCVDLFGGNLRKSLNTEKEFIDMPTNYNPKDVLFADNFSYILNEDGKLFSRRNFSEEAFYSGVFSNFPVGFKDNGKFAELNVDQFVHGINYRDVNFMLVYEKANKRFLALSDFVPFRDVDRCGEIMPLVHDDYEAGFIPLHNTGDNELVYSRGFGVSSWGRTGFYTVFKTKEGKYKEQIMELKFDAYSTKSMIVYPMTHRYFPDGFVTEETVFDVPDSGGGYGSTNVFLSKGNKLYYYSRVATGEIKPIEYYSFDADIVAMDDQTYQNRRMCIGLSNGEVYFMDVTDEAIGGQSDKLLHKVSTGVGNIKQIMFKNGRFQM